MNLLITIGLLSIAGDVADSQFELRNRDGTVKAIALDAIPKDNWLTISQTKHPRPDWPTVPQAIFANGDRLAGTLVSGDDRSLKLKTAVGEITVPLSALDILWVVEPPAESSPFPDRYAWLKYPRKNDVILLANGDTMIGDLETFSDLGNLKIKVEGTSRMIPKDRIQAIAFNPALSVTKKPKGAWYHITLRDGSRIAAGAIVPDKHDLKITTLFKETMTVPMKSVVSIDRHDDQLVELASLKPSKVESVPYLNLTWPWTTNRTVKQNPLRIQTESGVETFDRGIGTHPKTTLSYDLAGQFAAFDCLVGMDAVTGRRGSAVVRFLVDDKEAKSFNLTAAEPQRIRIDVTKAKTLTLFTDFTAAGDVQADVNWVNSLLLK